MRNFYIVYVLSILAGAKAWPDNKQRRFPDNFLFGTSTAAYQIEGAWDTDGKGESIWDRFVHDNPEVITDGSNGDVAADSYHLYKRDVEMLRELGVNFYRFSVSWPRVLPTGLVNDINEKALQYYDNLIDELLKHNIEPMITLYHFDLPQKLQDLGGWTNPWSVEWFRNYSNLIFDRYAHKVKYWITINQPYTICMFGYGDNIFAPAVDIKGYAEYLCSKNVLLAHAEVYRLYEKMYKPKYKGSVGISMAVNWVDPFDNSTENILATEEYREFTIGLYLNPIFSSSGDFPSIVKRIVAEKSKEQGFPSSRLPVLSADEIELLKGSADFLGVNHYTTFLVSRSGTEFESPSFNDDVDVDLTFGEEWKRSRSPWLRSVPYGIYKMSLYLNKYYNYPPIIITEHGWSTETGHKDTSRVENMRKYLSALLLAMEDGTNVLGYTVWSLMDNVEWTAGISERFGLYEVDFDSEEKTRTARLSALVYKNIIETRVIDENWLPDNLKIEVSTKRPKTVIKTEL